MTHPGYRFFFQPVAFLEIVQHDLAEVLGDVVEVSPVEEFFLEARLRVERCSRVPYQLNLSPGQRER